MEDVTIIFERDALRELSPLRPYELITQHAERTGPGETADFEVSFPTSGVWRLEVKTQLSGWHFRSPCGCGNEDAGASPTSPAAPL
jgi:hypothetical protein